MTDPDEVISNGENGATGRWLREMADQEHQSDAIPAAASTQETDDDPRE